MVGGRNRQRWGEGGGEGGGRGTKRWGGVRVRQVRGGGQGRTGGERVLYGGGGLGLEGMSIPGGVLGGGVGGVGLSSFLLGCGSCLVEWGGVDPTASPSSWGGWTRKNSF